MFENVHQTCFRGLWKVGNKTKTNANILVNAWRCPLDILQKRLNSFIYSFNTWFFESTMYWGCHWKWMRHCPCLRGLIIVEGGKTKNSDSKSTVIMIRRWEQITVRAQRMQLNLILRKLTLAAGFLTEGKQEVSQ